MQTETYRALMDYFQAVIDKPDVTDAESHAALNALVALQKETGEHRCPYCEVWVKNNEACPVAMSSTRAYKEHFNHYWKDDEGPEEFERQIPGESPNLTTD